MRVLVTGASGFIGSRLVPELAAGGHSLRTFGRSPQPADFACEVEHVRGDITEEAAVRAAVDGMDAVYHLAGLVSYRRRDREIQHAVNVLGTRNVMRAALDAGVKRVIYTGSIAGMGIPATGTVGDESIKYNLHGLGLNYCDSKFAAEQEAFAAAARGLDLVVLNPGIIFGEGDTHRHHRAIFLVMARGWLIGWPKGGVTFCDIDDVVAAHVNALTLGRSGERYVVGSANLTYRQAAATLSSVLGFREPAFEIPGFVLAGAGFLCEEIFESLHLTPPLTRQVAYLAGQRIFFSNEKAVAELKMPVTPFADTIRRTAPYYMGLLGGKPGGAAPCHPGKAVH